MPTEIRMPIDTPTSMDRHPKAPRSRPGRRMRALAPFILGMMLLSGCAGPSEDADVMAESMLPGPAAGEPRKDAAAEGPSSGGTQEANVPDEPRSEQLYSFAGRVIGASPGHPTGFGPLVPGGPASRVDTFEVPAGTIAIAVKQGLVEVVPGSYGTAAIRIEITAPDGTLVYATSNIYEPTGSTCIFCPGKEMDQATPGTYTVSYYVTGVVGLSLRVEATIEGPPSDPAPVVFFGHIVAPDPSHHEQGWCGGYGGGYDLVTKDTTWNRFGFDEANYDNWTFSFDVSGLVADFSGWGGPTVLGIVPPGSKSVTVCSRSAVNAAYRLTLRPPGAAVFSGHLMASHPSQAAPYGACSGPGSYQDASQWVTWQAFEFQNASYDGWSFAFNAGGVVARFYDGSSWHAASDAGTVPAGSMGVKVCNVEGIDKEFQLILQRST